ncbi:MAG: hypothetical protein Q8P24_04095 [Desulfobacterales bacterium]|nr:hypothetical protein [Desulfobacterales bacterium]
MFRKMFVLTALFVFSISVWVPPSAMGQSKGGSALPKATQKMLKDLKLTAGAVGDMDQQLVVPQQWIEGAKKERGMVRLGTMDPNLQEKFIAPFLERYPFVKNYEYNEGGQEDKIKAVEALKGGKATYDTIDGIEGLSNMLKAAKGLTKVNDLPNWRMGEWCQILHSA